MEEWCVTLFATMISSVIDCIIVFQFIESRNKRAYYNRYVYYGVYVVSCILIIAINSFNIPALNMTGWFVLCGGITAVFYMDNYNKAWRRVLTVYAMVSVLSVCETVGYMILKCVTSAMGLPENNTPVVQCVNVIFAKLFCISMYYFVICRIWKNKYQERMTTKQCVLLIAVLTYSMINLSAVGIVAYNEASLNMTGKILLFINMFCVSFGAVFLLFFIRLADENSTLESRNKLLEQQSSMQYEYYSAQEDKYNDSFRIIHDVYKHLNVLQQVYNSANAEISKDYADDIKNMLTPLIVMEYTNNPILNIILNDKRMFASSHNIVFDVNVSTANLKKMDALDVTTLFGNLLDNAVEAALNSNVPQRYVSVAINTYNDFIAINIKNSSDNSCVWTDGKPRSNKGKGHGIGLTNVEAVIEKYNGNMMLDEKDNCFECNIIISKID